MLIDDMFGAGDRPPTTYERAPEHEGIVRELDVVVPMRDGVKLVLDVYRPDAPGRFPALLAFGGQPKHIQGPDFAVATPPQPAWSTLWTGHMEAGDTRFFVSRGYIHVIGSPRGIGKSESGGSRELDAYDLIEWVAAQPWCDGQVGMVGIGAFGAEQFARRQAAAAASQDDLPVRSARRLWPLGGFREEYPGGVHPPVSLSARPFSAAHRHKGQPGELPPAQGSLWREAMANADYRMYPHVFNVVAQKGQHMPHYFDLLIDPYDDEKAVERERGRLRRSPSRPIPGAGWYGYTYKTHLNGAQNYFANIAAPKKLTLAGPSHLERPWRSFRNEMLRWYDHWLKGIDSGMMDEPPVKYWVMGANEWRSADDWPLPETRWTKLYLNSWERLSAAPFTPASNDEVQPPDVFVQMPPTQTNRIARLRYMTDPLPRRPVGRRPDRAQPVRRDRPGRHQLDHHSQGRWPRRLGAHGARGRARDRRRPARARIHPRLAQGLLPRARSGAFEAVEAMAPIDPRGAPPVVPGKIDEYAIEILSTANLFRRDHRICLEITSLDLPTGVAARPMPNTFPIILAPAGRRCTGSTVISRTRRTCCCRSFRACETVPTEPTPRDAGHWRADPG